MQRKQAAYLIASGIHLHVGSCLYKLKILLVGRKNSSGTSLRHFNMVKICQCSRAYLFFFLSGVPKVRGHNNFDINTGTSLALTTCHDLCILLISRKLFSFLYIACGLYTRKCTRFCLSAVPVLLHATSTPLHCCLRLKRSVFPHETKLYQCVFSETLVDVLCPGVRGCGLTLVALASGCL